MSQLVSSSTARLVLVTAPPAEAAQLARSIVQAKLAACVQLSDVRSIYAWQDKIEEQPETRLAIKTTADRLDALSAHIRKRHSYEVPQFIVVSIDSGTPGYLKWLDDETRL